jgi:hypothetical protein
MAMHPNVAGASPGPRLAGDAVLVGIMRRPIAGLPLVRGGKADGAGSCTVRKRGKVPKGGERRVDLDADKAIDDVAGQQDERREKSHPSQPAQAAMATRCRPTQEWQKHSCPRFQAPNTAYLEPAAVTMTPELCAAGYPALSPGMLAKPRHAAHTASRADRPSREVRASPHFFREYCPMSATPHPWSKP